MLKKLLFLSLFSVFSLSGFAQNADSITVAKTKWQKTRVAKHVLLFKHHFNQKNLFSANENISFIEVKNKGRKAVLAVDAEEKELITTSILA